MSCLGCNTPVSQKGYCLICQHCGEVSCVKCGYDILKNCLNCGNYNKKYNQRVLTMRLLELIEKEPFHKNRTLFYVAIGNYYIDNKDYKEAFKWNTLAAVRGNPTAQYYIGNVYFRGYPEIGNQPDYQEAMKWLTIAAENGIRGAFYYLGIMYRDALGVPENPYKSTVCFCYGGMKGHAKCRKEFISSFNNDGYGFPSEEKINFN